jgi:hypothetical protein
MHSWLYSLRLTIDANFRLKNKDRGIKDDPPLSDGWGHIVPETPYQEYIGKYGYQAEVSDWLRTSRKAYNCVTVAQPL